ncbi:MAG TPA: SDR family NAD(P)-dependent oxidoreductase, partial [Stellaceae bacterium]|nr:SDR family NAD(P)-dependent oxidoreductase [Stellaceae bacterium]
MNRLDGKVALISGAARGIGAETARLMIEAGAKVAIGDVLDERGRDTAKALGDGAFYRHLDVTREADWTALVDDTVARFGGLDILVNNAGLFLGKGIEDATLDEWHRLA